MHFYLWEQPTFTCGQNNLYTSMMMAKKGRSGRKRDHIYNNFEAVPNATKRFQCLFCDMEMNQDRSRMITHLAKRCKGADAEVKSLCKEILEEKRQGDANKSAEVVKAASFSASVTDSKMSSKSQKILKWVRIKNHFMPQLTLDENHSYQDEITLALISSDTLWNILDNPRFCKAQEVLRPGLQHLTAKKASTSVLNRLSALTERDTQNHMSGKISNACV